jgi:NTP pyrophosphatase (non-canonical NTP hydrolase)
MERKLQENDWKDGWEKCSLSDLLPRLIEEVIEILEELKGGPGVEICSAIASSHLEGAAIALHRIDEEEADPTITRAQSPRRFQEECADVANFCMMLADLARTQKKRKKKPA